MDVLRQLQISHPRDTGVNVWDELRGVSVERTFSDALASGMYTLMCYCC